MVGLIQRNLYERLRGESICLYISVPDFNLVFGLHTHARVFFCPAGILSRMTWQTGRSEDGVELNEHYGGLLIALLPGSRLIS